MRKQKYEILKDSGDIGRYVDDDPFSIDMVPFDTCMPVAYIDLYRTIGKTTAGENQHSEQAAKTRQHAALAWLKGLPDSAAACVKVTILSFKTLDLTLAVVISGRQI